MLSSLLAFCWFKQAGCLVSFPREFNVLIRFFVSGVTWSVRVSSGGSRLETRGIAGTAA